MLEDHLPLAEYPANQEPAVAIERILFAAHYRCAILSRFVGQLLNALEEEGRPRHLRVEDVALRIIEVVADWAAAQLVAHIDVADFATLDGHLQLRAVELRHIPRVGLRAYIYERLDVVIFQERKKCVESVVGMTDGEDNERLVVTAGGLLRHLKPL